MAQRLALLFVAVLCLLCREHEALAGFHVGNGGDLVWCRPEDGTPYAGYYALDFLATEGLFAGHEAAPVPVADAEASLARIHGLLAEKAPGLLESFHSFRRTLWNTGDYSQERVWEAAPFGLVELSDETLVAALPPACRTDTGAAVVQAVVRQFPDFSGANNGKIIYKFVPALVKEVGASRPLQLSFLLVHEWLWDLSTNVDRNRRINRLLHSAWAADMPAQEFRAVLQDLGLVIPELAPDPFSPDSCRGAALRPEQWKAGVGRRTGFFLLGKATLHARRRSCAAGECLKRWEELGAFFETSLAHFLAAHVGNETSLVLVNERAIRRRSGRLTCVMRGEDELRFECGPFFPPSAEGMPYRGLTFDRVVLTPECLRAEARQITTNIDGVSTEVQLVVHSRFSKPFPAAAP